MPESRWREPTRWWRGATLDLALVVVGTGVMVVAAAESGDQPARPVDGWSVAAIAAVGAWFAVARRAPRTALVGASLTLLTIFALGVPGFSPALALGVPIFLVAWSGHLWWAVAVLVAIGVFGPPYRLTGPGAEPLGQVLLHTLFDLSLLAVLLLLGEALRSRRALRKEAELRLRLAEQEHQRRATQERLRTARDLHDILSHTLALVGIQANVASENLHTRPDRADQALAQVRSATREAMSDLRSTIAVLREDRAGSGLDELAPAPGLAQLPELVEAVRQAGLTASLHLAEDRPALRPAVELVVYRVVQESLTNTLRHADAGTVVTTIQINPDQVRVEVRDDGSGPAAAPRPDPHPGSGLRGMAERVAALGGELWCGAAQDGTGFMVRATLPLGQRG